MNVHDAPFDVHILSFAFRRDRISDADYKSNENRRPERPDLILLSGASSVKNGPRTELAVPPETVGLFSPSTRADTPSTSDRRMNSCLIGLQVWPVRVRKLIAVIHSSVVRLRKLSKYVAR